MKLKIGKALTDPKVQLGIGILAMLVGGKVGKKITDGTAIAGEVADAVRKPR